MTFQENVRVTALGRKGLLPSIMKIIGSIPEPDRTKIANGCNELKHDINQLIDYVNELEVDVREKHSQSLPTDSSK